MLHLVPGPTGGLLMLATLACNFAAQVAWYRRDLRCGLPVGTGYAAAAIFSGIMTSLGSAGCSFEARGMIVS